MILITKCNPLLRSWRNNSDAKNLRRPWSLMTQKHSIYDRWFVIWLQCKPTVIIRCALIIWMFYKRRSKTIVRDQVQHSIFIISMLNVVIFLNLDLLFDTLKTIKPSCVANEKVFSISGNLISKTRTRLSHRSVDILCFLKPYILKKSTK